MDIKNKLYSLLQIGENEIIEFKGAVSSFNFDELGKYFSALSNQANLGSQENAWLVLGVNDKKQITGTSYREDTNQIKQRMAEQISNRLSFTNIHDIIVEDKRVVMFEIPAAPKGMVVGFKGQFWGRNGSSIVPLNIEKIQRISSQHKDLDWSKKIIPDVSIEVLDSEAISEARLQFKKKHPDLSNEIDSWDDTTFLDKAKITINGKVTNSAILLLGKVESSHLLSDAVVEISWILFDEKNEKIDYEHFCCPLLLNTDKVLSKIRNLNYRYLPDSTLFPEEVKKYEPYVIREALHNCIAHQDYSLAQRVIVSEHPDFLEFENAGSFIPETIESVINNEVPSYYRNKFLTDAMVKLNMIDTIGSGIRRMFTMQRNRFFPLPDYDFSNKKKVKVTIFGKIIDPKYTELLKKAEITLENAILLDKFQKKKLSDEEIKSLRTQKLIEGRKPNYHISSRLAAAAAATDDYASYIKSRSLGDEFYKGKILELLKMKKEASRKDIDSLLLSMLPNVLDFQQKRNKIRNLLYAMSRSKIIQNIGNGKSDPKWVILSKRPDN